MDLGKARQDIFRHLDKMPNCLMHTRWVYILEQKLAANMVTSPGLESVAAPWSNPCPFQFSFWKRKSLLHDSG
ncbi:hypothetical protein SASPL_126952 [Salvia splendens]|uniref:Uncharacterized protein n=1 Tax=Salvia splendens TaxID=180675 RepID=A0A8X8XKG5_SALSN|nr:hypothetical protein SASPL_126952 [Salvia splendens]